MTMKKVAITIKYVYFYFLQQLVPLKVFVLYVDAWNNIHADMEKINSKKS